MGSNLNLLALEVPFPFCLLSTASALSFEVNLVPIGQRGKLFCGRLGQRTLAACHGVVIQVDEVAVI